MSALIDEAAYYAKGLAGLVTAVATSLLTIFGPETEVGKYLTIAVAVAGAISVYGISNRPRPGDELEDPDGLIYADGEEADDAGEHRAES